MKISVLLVLLICLLPYSSFSQLPFGADGDCSPNIFLPHPLAPNPSLVRATFKYHVYANAANNSGRSSCTGTLLNQVVSGKPRQFFVTARHCLHIGDNGTGQLVDTTGMDFIFNYQSSNGNNSAVPATIPFLVGNRGDLNPPGYRYTFRSRVELVYESTALFNTGYGIDIALLEIKQPIPPHFNVYFAGWKADALLGLGGFLNAPMTVIHHPRGDVKKFTSASFVLKNENSLATGCRTITKVIDFIVSLFGGRSITETICSYVDIPQYVVPVLSPGSLSVGSSGSPFFTNGNRLFATATGTFGSGYCDNIAQTFGKFRNAYANREMRDRLNPIYNAPANAFGYDGRDIGCYTANPLRLSGDYFPARNYQPNNAIVISANQNIEAGQVDSDNNGRLTAFVDYVGPGNLAQVPQNDPIGVEERRLQIYSGADFTFTAGQSIRLLPGFTVAAGANFTARIQGCNGNSRQGVDETSNNSPPVVLPALTKQEEAPTMTLSPNPSGSLVTCQYWVKQPGPVKIDLFDIQGKEISTLYSAPNVQPGAYAVEQNIAAVQPGVYLVRLKSTNHTESKRLLVQR